MSAIGDQPQPISDEEFLGNADGVTVLGQIQIIVAPVTQTRLSCERRQKSSASYRRYCVKDRNPS